MLLLRVLPRGIVVHYFAEMRNANGGSLTIYRESHSEPILYYCRRLTETLL